MISTDNQTGTEDTQIDPEIKKKNDAFRSRIEACKTYKRKLIGGWNSNIDYRRGKIFSTQSDEDRVVVNLDWPMTKAKQAALYSQTPKLRVDHPPETLNVPWLAKYETKLNDTLASAGIEPAMEEVLPDVINAAGIGAVLIARESISESVDLPLQDPSLPVDPTVDPTGSNPLPFTLPRTLESRYVISRISPSDILFPVNYDKSNFEVSPWVGRSGRMTWASGVQWLKLNETDKVKIIGEDRQFLDRLSPDSEKDRSQADEMISFDEIFYREFEYDPKAQSYSLIHHLVFVHGKSDPVLDEPWKGQQVRPDGQIIGSLKYPLQFITLSYLTDEAIPPSESAVSRPTVNEINRARTQMIQQRERSIPVRWFDINRIDTAIQQTLMRGQWQSFIPVQGDGSRSIGEVAKSSMPAEDFAFDKVAKEDLQQISGVGPNQEGSGQGIDTAGEANIVQSNFQTRIGRERAKVAKFFCSIGEVLGGLIALYEPPQSFGDQFDPTVARTLSYSILADSTVLLDSNQKLDRLMKFINFNAKSGWVVIEPVLREIAQLSGLDPNIVIKAPQPAPPVEPTISLRLTGVEDLMNPLTLAFLMKSGQAPSPDLIEQAKQLIQTAVVPPQPTQMPGSNGVVPPVMPEMGLGGPGGGPGGPISGGGGPTLPPPGPVVLSNPIPPPVPIVHQPPIHPPQPGLAHPNWSLMPHVSKNADEK